MNLLRISDGKNFLNKHKVFANLKMPQVTLTCTRIWRIPGLGSGWNQLPCPACFTARSGGKDGEQNLPDSTAHHAWHRCTGKLMV